MGDAWKDIARDAGFYSASERLSLTTCQKPAVEFCGIRIVGEPLMPDGYVALVSNGKATVIGPKGAWSLPLGDPFAAPLDEKGNPLDPRRRG